MLLCDRERGLSAEESVGIRTLGEQRGHAAHGIHASGVVQGRERGALTEHGAASPQRVDHEIMAVAQRSLDGGLARRAVSLSMASAVALFARARASGR